MSKSEQMRELARGGLSIGEISKKMNCHYSFVYGVVSSMDDFVKVEKDSKSDKIRQMATSGMTVGQIAKELNANYSFVFSVVKKFKNK